MRTKILISISICLSIAGICYADKIYFKDRNPIEGEIVQETDEVVVIEQSAGRYGSVTSSHSKKSIDHIEKASPRENAEMKATREKEAHEDAIMIKGAKLHEASNIENGRQENEETQSAMHFSPGVPRGYGNIEFGMTREKIKEILRGAGAVITGEDETRIRTNEMFFGKNVLVFYTFTPTTQKCMNIFICFPRAQDLTFYGRLSRVLIEKYGKPYPGYVEGQSLPKWTWGKIVVFLFDKWQAEQEEFVALAYVDEDLVAQGKKEQGMLDKKWKSRL